MAAALVEDFVRRAIEKARRVSAFTPDSGPHAGRDFGSFELDARAVFWKIDLYEGDLTYRSPNPADPDVTVRVLTVLLTEEY